MKSESAMSELIVADTTKRFIPFYSERTLEEVHQLVKELANGLAVYAMKDRTLATIGSRGIRLPDGSPGLIIHASVKIAAAGVAQIHPSDLVETPFYSLDLSPVGADQLIALLIGALQENGLLPASAVLPGRS